MEVLVQSAIECGLFIHGDIAAFAFIMFISMLGVDGHSGEQLCWKRLDVGMGGFEI